MALGNQENTEWNNLHDGSRVPVNDTGIPGAAFALCSTPNWEEGCINKAVVDAWVINGGTFEVEDVENAENLSLAFNDLSPYIFKDMLYGYNGEAYNQEPIGTMDYRGYPTPLQFALTTDVKYAFSSYFYTPGGILGTLERNTVLNLNLTITYKLPYPVYGVVTVTNQNTAEVTTYETKIDAGSVNITHYREPQLDPLLADNVWLGILSGSMYLSVNTVGLTDPTLNINVTYTHTTEPITNSSTINDNYAITLAEYSTDITGTVYLGEIRKMTSLTSPECFIQICNEISRETIIGNSNSEALFLELPGSIAIGTKLLTVSGGSGIYWTLDFAYTLDGIDVFTVVRELTLDANDYIVDIKNNPSGWMGSSCWINSSCQ